MLCLIGPAPDFQNGHQLFSALFGGSCSWVVRVPLQASIGIL